MGDGISDLAMRKIIGTIALLLVLGCTVKTEEWIEATPTAKPYLTATPDRAFDYLKSLAYLNTYLEKDIQEKKNQRDELILQIEAYQIKLEKLKSEWESLNGNQETTAANR